MIQEKKVSKMKIQVFASNQKVIRKYLDIVNCSLGLTARELDVLALLFQLDITWDSTSNNIKNIINTESRRYIMLNTYINKNNLSKYIKKYKSEGILVEHSPKKWRINSNLMPSNAEEIDITFILKSNNNE